MAPSPHRGLPVAVRISAFYAVFFTVLGVMIPFWPVWLASRGLGPAEISLLLSISLAGKALVSPVLAWVCDRTGKRRGLIALLSAAAALVFAGLWWADGFAAVLMLWLGVAVCWTGLMPLADNLTLITAQERGLDYGRMRLWGSLAFIAAAALMGKAVGMFGPPAIFFGMLAGIIATAAFAHGLPDTRTPPAAAGAAPARALLKQPSFVLFLVAAALIQGGHGVYYAFATLHWQAAGIGEATIGLLWAEGVVAEVVLFAYGGAAMRRLGPVGLLLLAAGAAVVRWSVLALTTEVAVLAVAQALHAFTFGACHLAAMAFISRAVPAQASASAQALHSAGAYGIGLGAATFAAGPLFAAFGPGAFLGSAVLGAAAAAAALALWRIWPGGRLDGMPARL